MGGTDPATTLVCDAGPLIHLDELNALSLLTDFHPILVPPAVWQEVKIHRPAALSRPEINLTLATPQEIPQTAFGVLARAFSLDAGEIAALQLMHQHPNALLLTDDAAARMVAEQLGFRVHGTIGILIRAIRRKQRSPQDVLSLLEQIPTHSTPYIRPALLEEILAALRKSFSGT